MPQLRSSTDVDVSAFLADGLGIKQHLSRYLELTPEQLEQRSAQQHRRPGGPAPRCVSAGGRHRLL